MILGEERINSLKDITIYDKDGNACKIKKAKIYGIASETPYIQIDLEKLPKSKDQPVVSQYIYDSYNINLKVSEEQNYPKAESFTVDTTDMKTEYQVGETVDYTGMKFNVVYADGTTAVIPFEAAAVIDGVDYDIYHQEDTFTEAGDQECRVYLSYLDPAVITFHVKEAAAANVEEIPAEKLQPAVSEKQEVPEAEPEAELELDNGIFVTMGQELKDLLLGQKD